MEIEKYRQLRNGQLAVPYVSEETALELLDEALETFYESIECNFTPLPDHTGVEVNSDGIVVWVNTEDGILPMQVKVPFFSALYASWKAVDANMSAAMRENEVNTVLVEMARETSDAETLQLLATDCLLVQVEVARNEATPDWVFDLLDDHALIHKAVAGNVAASDEQRVRAYFSQHCAPAGVKYHSLH